MNTREYAVRICDGCINLEGEQCNTPECAFCRKTTKEIAELLESCQLRYVVDGEIIDVHQSAIVSVLPKALVDQLSNVIVKLRQTKSQMPSTGDIGLRQMIGRTCHQIDELLSENEVKVMTLQAESIMSSEKERPIAHARSHE